MSELYASPKHESRFFDSGEWLDYEPAYRLKVITFANKTVDFIMRAVKPHKLKENSYGMQTSYPKQLTDEELQAKRLENIERAARRAKQMVHHHIRQIGADHMLTLHTRENITDKDEFYKIFARFIRLVKTKQLATIKGQKVLKTRKVPVPYPYLAAHELQQRGAYHMHVACVGYQDLNLLRACWYTALGGNPNDTGADVKGQVDVQFNQKRFSGQSEIFKTFKLVGYLTKYITKSFEDSDQLGEKRYSSDRQTAKPIVNKQFLLAKFDYGDKPFIEGLKEVYNYAAFIGAKELEPWSRGYDVFVLRGELND